MRLEGGCLGSIVESRIQSHPFRISGFHPRKCERVSMGREEMDEVTSVHPTVFRRHSNIMSRRAATLHGPASTLCRTHGNVRWLCSTRTSSISDNQHQKEGAVTGKNPLPRRRQKEEAEDRDEEPFIQTRKKMTEASSQGTGHPAPARLYKYRKRKECAMRS